MLPIVDAVLMALFLAGLIVYVVAAGRRSGGDADQRTSDAPTAIGPASARESAEERGVARDSRPRSFTQSALLAALLSFLAPGLGHFLIGAKLRGAIFLAGWVVLAIVSGALHGPVALVWMFVAGIDAYLFARAGKSPSDPAGAGPVNPSG
ncbi:MAG: hypothetical protein JST59_29110 [Actinobacteria bacterium]|nr:hypothetical protein [Actinomycetota bacterium]